MKVEIIFASNSQVVLGNSHNAIYINDDSYACELCGCYSELSVQHNLVVQGDFALIKHKWRHMSIILMIRHA